ncbi:MAG: hypothetical protein HQK51_16870 [Oligoflexia bacterium]|nr:hypothetical protein [Oligoflexia bacterium]
MIGIEYALASVQLKLTSPQMNSEDYSGKYKETSKGILLGFANRITPIMVWGTYYFDTQYEYGGERTTDSGNGWAVSVAVISFKPISFFASYKNTSTTSKGLNSSKEPVGSDKLKTKEVLLGVGLQFWIQR